MPEFRTEKEINDEIDKVSKRIEYLSRIETDTGEFRELVLKMKGLINELAELQSIQKKPKISK